MGREDWYRNSTWSAAEQQQFFARLKRSRGSSNKAQYLRVQAVHLADAGHFAPAIELLDQLFRDFPDPGELAVSHLQKAECLVELGQLEAAVDEFRSSLQAQRDFPNVGTECWLLFPWLIVRQRMTAHYNEALAVLEEFNRVGSLTFPIHQYRYAAVRALIAHERGDLDDARKYATLALQSAAQTHSGFRYHPAAGLVRKVDSEIHARLTAVGGA